MKKIFTIILIGTLSINLLGCQNQSEEIPDSHLKKTEPKIVEQEKKTENNNEETISEEYNEIKYESDNIRFEYPNTWEIKELQYEDGKEISFWDQKGEKVLWIERGEAWRVNLEMDEEDYKELLLETYNEVEIIELSKTNIDGYEAQILAFSYNCDGMEKIIKRYIVIIGYAFCEINISSIISDKEVASFVDSIEFISK